MGTIEGRTIILHEPVEVGQDGFKNPIFEYVQSEVENVLIAPVTAEDIRTNTDMAEKEVKYILGIPKGDSHNWTNARVEFFGKTWITVGEPIGGIEELIPLSWNQKVGVARYE